MMKNIESKISEAAKLVDLKSEASIQEAVCKILENGDFKSGSKVAVIDDPTYSMAGQVGKVKGVSTKGSGFVDVEFENGLCIPLQSTLLLSL
jgi:hypothetical protein